MIANDVLSCDRSAFDLIAAIGRRLREEVPTVQFDPLSLAMDLTVCQNRGHVDLQALLDAPYGTFVHDLDGIHNHLDRETGELADCFLPRCQITKG